MTEFIEKLARHVVMLLFTLSIVVLTAISLINTCYLDDNEHTYFTFQTGGSFLLLTGVLVLLFLAFYNCKEELLPKLNIRYILLFSFLLGIFFVMITQVQPRADQKVCLMVAEQMHQGNFEAFKSGNYMQAYPQQVGIVLVYYLLGFLFGSRNIVSLHVINIFAYTWFIYSSYRITKQLFHTKTLANGTAILCIIFLPLLFYTSFIYGTMLGLAFSTAAITKAIAYTKQRKGIDGILCALFAGIAVLLKKNYLIVILALLILLLFHAICKKHRRALLSMALIVMSYFCFTSGAKLITEKITGEQLGDGIPSIAWVTMGLQEGSRASGWYNRYSVNVYQDHYNDSTQTTLAATKDLKERLHSFATHPLSAVNFFTRKTASQWSDPSFQCFFILKDPVMNMKESPLLFDMLDGTSNRYLQVYLDLLQSVIYLGLFFFCIYEWRRLRLWDLLPAIVFLGGFLFHLFWEAKGQYTICYFVLLFPYCLKGYSRLFYKGIAVVKAKRLEKRKKLITTLSPLLIWLVLGLLYSICCLMVPSVKSAVASANSNYTSYLSSLQEEVVPIHGTYRLKSKKGNKYLTFTKAPSGAITASLSKKTDSSQLLRVQEGKSTTKFMITKFNKQLGHVTLRKIPDPTLERRKSYYSTTPWYSFTLIEHQNGSYSLKNNDNYALTYSKDGTVTLEAYQSSNKRQRWILEKVAVASTAKEKAEKEVQQNTQ